MSEKTAVKNNTWTTEAPASWNTRYMTPDGFVCQLTLRGVKMGATCLKRPMLLWPGCVKAATSLVRTSHLAAAAMPPPLRMKLQPKAMVTEMVVAMTMEAATAMEPTGALSTNVRGNIGCP